jgi:hypothetical protein
MSLALLKGRITNVARRAADALEFFPLTVLYALARAARRTKGATEVGVTTDAGATFPAQAMLWLGRLVNARPAQAIDVCLRLPREASGTGVPDAFSIALTFPRVRSISFYWDEPSLEDDLRVFCGGDSPPLTLGGEPAGAQRLPMGEIQVPLTASRDALTLLKRHAGGAAVVLVNLRESLAAARPDLHFFHLNAGLGFTLHERMALVRAADAYIGEADELACMALLSGRPALLVDAGAPAASEIGAFLSRHFAVATASTPARSSTSPGS